MSPHAYFPDCSQNDEGNVQRQAVKVPWDFSPGAPVLPILQRWGPWMTLLNHRFSLCVLGWLTNPAVSSTFFWFTPCNKEVTTGSLPTRANRSAISSALTMRTPCFSTTVGQYHLVPLPRPPSPWAHFGLFPHFTQHIWLLPNHIYLIKCPGQAVMIVNYLHENSEDI